MIFGPHTLYIIYPPPLHLSKSVYNYILYTNPHAGRRSHAFIIPRHFRISGLSARNNCMHIAHQGGEEKTLWVISGFNVGSFDLGPATPPPSSHLPIFIASAAAAAAASARRRRCLRANFFHGNFVDTFFFSFAFACGYILRRLV